MTERPILFSGEMVRAILAGTKTMTRRLVRPTPPDGTTLIEWNTANEAFVPWRWGMGLGGGGHRTGEPFSCPYGVPGDRLWVRETSILPVFDDDPTEVIYAADFDDLAAKKAEVQEGADGDVRWRPSIHMPRWASRIDLEVTAVRVERLQDITEEDARAEGVSYRLTSGPETSFAHLWDSINGKRAAWASNPWVWVVSFKRVSP